MACDHFFHILRFLHFEDNDNPLSRDDPDYERLWKIRKIFDTLSNKFCEMYNPTEHLAVDEIIMLYKGKVIFRQYIPKKHKRFGIKHSQHWPSKGKQRQCRLCLLEKQTRSMLHFCNKCDVSLCIVNCSEKWHATCEPVSR